MSEIMHTPVYVDKQLITSIGVQLVGLRIDQSRTKGGGASLNWLIQSNISVSETDGIARDITELLPERVLYMIYPEIKHKFLDVEKAVNTLALTGDNKMLPGEPVSIKGSLSFPDIGESVFDPFSPPELLVKTFQVHGESCFVGKLEGNGFTLPLYFLEEAKQQVGFCNKMAVEAVGIVRWSPAYSTGGAKSLNLIVRVAALLLR